MGRKKFIKKYNVSKELFNLNNRMNKAELDIFYVKLNNDNIYTKINDLETEEVKTKIQLDKIKRDKIKKIILTAIIVILSISGYKIGMLSYLIELL